MSLGPRHSIARRLVGMGALAIMAGVAGCAAGDGGIRTVRGDLTNYSLNHVRYAASQGEMRLLLGGRPFPGVSPAALASKVIAEIAGRPQGVAPVRYVEGPLATVPSAYYVSLVFNPPAGFDGHAACDEQKVRDAGGKAATSGQSLRVVGAFCNTVKMLSETVGEADHVGQPDDPRFQALLRQVMSDLFPQRDPNIGVDACGGAKHCKG